MKKGVALLTCSKLGGLSEDDLLLIKPLENLGNEVTVCSWDDPQFIWNEFNLVVIRSTWDYHYRSKEFTEWILQRKVDGTALWNPPDAVLWNLNKSYLLELERNGIRIVPTVHIGRNQKAGLYEIMKRQQWNKVVVKPDVSASSYRTWITSIDEKQDEREVEFDSMLKESGVLVQDFRKEVLLTGEWSLIFFERKFSHAVLKTPAPGNFKVQHECGGTIHPTQPSLSVIKTAHDILSKISGPLLYARVDGIETENEFLLMEVELIEPGLFLNHNKQAPEKFAQSILERASH